MNRPHDDTAWSRRGLVIGLTSLLVPWNLSHWAWGPGAEARACHLGGRDSPA
jgi:hypothetical protein